MYKKQRHFFTSESVTEGHPDKMCDQISDAILDAIFEKDRNARVACESSVSSDLVVLSGEITTDCAVDFLKIVRETIREIGYTNPEYGLDADTCKILIALNKQSPDIAMGVNRALEAREGLMGEDEIEAMGAGDQGLMFGFACNETEELMPLSISLSNKLARRLTEVRKNGVLGYLRPDGKVQVTVEYEGTKPIRIDTIVISAQHNPNVELEQIKKDVHKHVIAYVVPSELIDSNTKYFINPTGRFVIGGPKGDAGLTGRKIIVDTYGGYARHGGGAFSGKDPTKVDRSGAYAARYVAKNIVAAGFADKCTLQLAYAIGVARPLSIYIDTHGTGKVPEDKLEKAVAEAMDLTPRGIRTHLDLNKPIYARTSSYGHFGRTPDKDGGFSWEKTDLVDALKRAI